MSLPGRTPPLDNPEIIANLPPRQGAYWNTLEYCRHIGVKKYVSGECYWTARIRTIKGGYRQTRIGKAAPIHPDGLCYEDALVRTREWFNDPENRKIAAQPYAVGVNSKLKYVKTNEKYTVGDALRGFIEWKRIAASKTYFETTLSLVNHHIIPRIGDMPVEELTQAAFTEFCVDVLESPPKKKGGSEAERVRVTDMDYERLRKRKKTLNTVIGFLKSAIEMAWENGDVKCERIWRRIRRVPHADSPRQHFLTRAQAKRLIAACRSDLALLVQAALYSGCRVSELIQLRARDIGGHVYGIYVAPMKSYRGRYVILPDEGMSFFLDQQEGLDDEDLVFRMDSGRAWQGSHKHLFREAVLRAGLQKDFVFHGLRHTYASQLVQAGAPLAVVARQLGHSNTDTVSRTYGHLCCDSIQTEISLRFAPLQRKRDDPRLEKLKGSLQTIEEPRWSWPQRNTSKASVEIVELLRTNEAHLHRR